MARYRKKPVVIEAIHVVAGIPLADISEFVGESVEYANSEIIIHTLEGDMRADLGDWIIKGVAGEFYPCKPDIFAQTYELAEEANGSS